MRLGGRRSTNVEDRRGMGGPVAVGGGLGGLVLVLLYVLLGGDPANAPIPQQAQQRGPGEPYQASAEEEQSRILVETVLADTEDVWREQLPAQTGQQYRDPALVLFTDAVQSACGTAGAETGPFYCPLDQKVYIDLGFYDQLKDRFRAPGDFAQAYVIAHEVGHHMQTLLGTSDEVRRAQSRVSRADANELSVRQELQADCYAGAWAFHAQRARNILESGDVEEALGAASAIGDDRIQRETSGRVSPESFTHGTSEQRVRWFRTGMQRGRMEDCDTFRTPQL
jgi:uncharacterized protein